MSDEIHFADWRIHYPVHCDGEIVPSLLQPFTLVEHTGEACPWHLTTMALNLLESPQSCYEYLHLVWFFRARAAMLALEGSVLDHKDLFLALSKHRVQAAGIYREHLIFHVRDFLRKQNLAGLPVCHCENTDAVEDNAKVNQNRQIIRSIIRSAEIAYLGTMNFISAASTMEEKVARHSVGFWAAGGGMPATLGVTGRVRRGKDGYVVRPTENDVKRMVLEGTPLRTIVVRGERGETCGGVGVAECRGDEAGGRREEGSGPASAGEDTGRRRGVTGGGKRTANSQQGMGEKEAAHKRTFNNQHPTSNAQQGPGGWEVAGDYKVIVLPKGGRRISLAKKHKARAMLRFIHQRLVVTGATEFYIEEMREGFNSQFGGNQKQRQWLSDRFREDLFRGMEAEFDMMFEAVDRAAGRYRVRE